MSTPGIKAAFASYGAALKNVNWSVSAETANGELVVSLWQHHFRKDDDGSLVCQDRFDRWSGPGNAEFRERVTSAFHTKQVIRLITVATDSIDAVQQGIDAGTLKKNFYVRADLVGEVAEIVGQEYKIRFSKR